MVGVVGVVVVVGSVAAITVGSVEERSRSFASSAFGLNSTLDRVFVFTT